MQNDDDATDDFNPYPYSPIGMGGGAGPYGYGMADMTPAAEEGSQAFAGDVLKDGVEFATQEMVEDALRTVHDPEIPVNIYDLGLIYECHMDDKGDVSITMTLTAPACPVAGEMPQMVADAVAMVDGVGRVTVTLTWAPPWEPDMMSEDAKLAMGF